MHEIQYVYDDRAEEQTIGSYNVQVYLLHSLVLQHFSCKRPSVCRVYQHCRFIEQLTQIDHSNIVHTYIHTIIQHNSAYCLLLVYVCTVLSPAPTDRQCILLLLRQYLEGQLLLCMI